MQRTAIQVYVVAIGGNVDCYNLRPQLRKNLGGNAVCGSIGAVNNHFYPIKGLVFYCGFCEFHVTAFSLIYAVCFSDFAAPGK